MPQAEESSAYDLAAVPETSQAKLWQRCWTRDGPRFVVGGSSREKADLRTQLATEDVLWARLSVWLRSTKRVDLPPSTAVAAAPCVVVPVANFSQGHFRKSWDSLGACSFTEALLPTRPSFAK